MKLHLSECFVESSLDALQIHGGYGYMAEYELERDVRDAIGSRIYSGTSDIQRNIARAPPGAGVTALLTAPRRRRGGPDAPAVVDGERPHLRRARAPANRLAHLLLDRRRRRRPRRPLPREVARVGRRHLRHEGGSGLRSARSRRPPAAARLHRRQRGPPLPRDGGEKARVAGPGAEGAPLEQLVVLDAADVDGEASGRRAGARAPAPPTSTRTSRRRSARAPTTSPTSSTPPARPASRRA